MIRLRLTAKIAAVIIVVLIFGFGASTVLTIKEEEELPVERSKAAARRLTSALIASVEAAMLQERPDVTRAMITELRGSSPVEGLDIYRRNGVEAFTDLATLEEVERNAGLPREVFENIKRMRRAPGRSMTGPLFQRGPLTPQPQEPMEYRDGVPRFTMYRPVINQEKCQGCHGSDHKVRAVVRVATTMEPVFAAVRAQRNRQILIALLTIVAAGGVLAVVMRQVVVKPIQAVAAVARRIGSGDFEARVPIRSGDEIGVLGGALNEMTGHLARARDEGGAR